METPGDQLTLTGAGDVVIRAEQSGDEHILAASQDRTIAISKAGQNLTWIEPAANSVLLMNQPTPLMAAASSGLPVTFRTSSGPAAMTGNAVTATTWRMRLTGCMSST